MTQHTSKQIIAMHLLPSKTRSKGNQAMEFDQLTEYNKRNIFLHRILQKMSQDD